MTESIDKKPSEILADAIKLLDGGANWMKEELADGTGSYCLLGAVSKAYYGEFRFNDLWHAGDDRLLYPKDSGIPALQRTNDYIVQACNGLQGYEINDNPETEFEDVQRVLCIATQLALEEESRDDAA